jgi:hypothetical protein
MKKHLFVVLLLLGSASEAVVTRLGVIFGALAAGGVTGTGVYHFCKLDHLPDSKSSYEVKRYKEDRNSVIKWATGLGVASGLISGALLYRRIPGVVLRRVQETLKEVDSSNTTKLLLESDFQKLLNEVDKYFILSKTPRIDFFKELSANMSQLQEARREIDDLRAHASELELDNVNDMFLSYKIK